MKTMYRLTLAISLLLTLFLGLACGKGDKVVDSGTDTDGDIDTDPLVCETPEDAAGFEFDEIPTWRHGAQSAYSFIHDDLCDYGVRGIHQYAIPALNQRGIVAGLGPYVEACDESDMWDEVAQFAVDGHEIINHSYTHDSVSVSNASVEVADAKTTIEGHIGADVNFYIFPYDYFTSSTITEVENAGHLGARAGNRDDNDGFDNPPINSKDPINDFEVEFDVWPRTYSKYALFYPEDILTVHIWNAIEDNGWAVREFHSVRPDSETDEGHGFGPVPQTTYNNHLDWLVDAWKKNYVWTAGPSSVIKYRHAREACDATVQNDTIVFDTSNSECTTYAIAISVIVTTGNDVASVQGMQNGSPVYTRKIAANTFSVTADPTKGDVVLSGCADIGPLVESGSIPAKPDPADSVCDIETVVGTGSDGAMDDLERPEEDFQVIPNPSQADGRTGSWSWYPQNADVTMHDDGGNTVLRYASTSALGAWTGVTLAFLGGNGAGTCYDASAYSGIQFRIRGSVNATDMNGQMIVSMVTAETQTQAYGGDLDGTGGHFNYVIDVTSSWQTITINWNQFNTPTWGDTQSLTSLAIGKLQAIDWGITDTHTSFEVFLDDIELI
jgi:hypothetical protein